VPRDRARATAGEERCGESGSANDDLKSEFGIHGFSEVGFDEAASVKREAAWLIRDNALLRSNEPDAGGEECCL
jgi:hypothetical protein